MSSDEYIYKQTIRQAIALGANEDNAKTSAENCIRDYQECEYQDGCVSELISYHANIAKRARDKVT